MQTSSCLQQANSEFNQSLEVFYFVASRFIKLTEKKQTLRESDRKYALIIVNVEQVLSNSVF